MTPSIAIVGMACIYPDARSPGELWENALAQRRAFRLMPPERLRVEDYLSTDKDAPDRTYVAQAAVIEGYEFDRVRFRVAGSTYRSADLAHWLALDVASQALADAGFPGGEGLPKETTGVLLGNTLTGEFSRANALRLRWPYVRRTVEARLAEEGWPPEQRHAFLQGLEEQYKAPFPSVGEETLAGGLSNTIAGRICNHFDLNGGGYTVDGACASSLLAVATACSSLVAGDLDVALAGGVDLSLDPFEIVGFAKTDALAPEEMRVYDKRSSGFWPGEGCGFVALMRHEDALAQGRRVHATIRGWGVSSDGSGGITRPEVEGQLLAVRRAYRRAGFGIDSVAYFEGHGTGTSVGDATELQMLSRARKEAAPDAPPAAIGTIKGNIGHTKAAAGLAGLIKATMALQAQILPPTTGCEEPHPLLTEESPALRVLGESEPWPQERPLRAGVSAMGFGGINTHVVLESASKERRLALGSRDRALTSSAQDAELFLLDGRDTDDLLRRVERLLGIAPRLSRAELADLAAQLEITLGGHTSRAAVVASKPAELASRLETLAAWLAGGVTSRVDADSGVFLGLGTARPRIGFLFPGQGSPAHLGGGALRRRFEYVSKLYAWASLPTGGDGVATEIAQPAIVTASMAALRVLEQLDIEASVGIGHSLGELTAYHWAGAIDKEALLRIAARRGKAMSELGSSTGAMASIKAGHREVALLLNGATVAIAGLNSPRQTVVSGEASAIDAVVARARAGGLHAMRLPVSHAFHSPLVAAAAPALAEQLARETFRPLLHKAFSTVTGASLAPDEDLRVLIHRQITEPVRFMEAVSAAADEVDLWIEAGPGRVLGGLVSEFTDVPIVALDAGGPSLKGLLCAAGAAFALGAPVNHSALFAGRFTKPFDLDWHPKFFANPCEQAPVAVTSDQWSVVSEQSAVVGDQNPAPEPDDSGFKIQNSKFEDPLDLVRQLVADRAELPLAAVKDDSRLLSDLHLNSIAVGQLVIEAARHLGLAAPASPTDFADASVAEVAQALEELSRTGGLAQADDGRMPPGVDTWVRAFTVELVERPLPRLQAPAGEGDWRVFAPEGHPLADSLGRALGGWGGGVLVCLPPDPDESHVSLLLDAAHAAIAERKDTRFVLVQHGGGAAGFAKTLHLEAPGITTCVVDVPAGHHHALEWIIAEAKAAVGYSEAHYDESGTRREPVLRAVQLPQEPDELPLGPDDVLLVTGGGKGIAAECALSIARTTGARLGLIGRSEPARDPELAANLDRMAALGANFRYVSADVTDAEAVQAAVREVEAELGAVTAVLHGAGANSPQLLVSLDEAALLRTLAPKVQGARNVLAAVDPGKLKLFVTFGSIIARTGMRGESDYALANEWMARLAERRQAEHPHCRCLSLEWSVWSGVGMGERLGRVEALIREGVTPIPPDEGIAMLRRLISQPLPAVSVVVAGRFGDPPTLKMERPDLPFARFLERPRVYYPGIELVVDAELSADTDPYLQDHVFHGEPLLPAVMGLEAMAQAALALVGARDDVGAHGRAPLRGVAFENVKLERPIVVPEGGTVTLRIAALVREPGHVEVVLRSEETAFQVDYFRAECVLADPLPDPEPDIPHSSPAKQAPGIPHSAFRIPHSILPIVPERDLYGGILFHTGRFRRLRGYRQLAATECLAEIAPDDGTAWFGRYLPQELFIGDPGMRDTVIHAVQACIPHSTLLPTGVDRIVINTCAPGPVFVHAVERSRDGDNFVYDLEVCGADGCLRERWEGLRLRRVESKLPQGAWAAPLLGPYIERRVQELLPGSAVKVAVEQTAEVGRRARSDSAIRRAVGAPVAVVRRSDGKPEVAGYGDAAVSAAHAGDLALAVAGPGPLACDMEPVVSRPARVWEDLLGRERLALALVISQSTGEDESTAATRVWAACECLKKAGAPPDAPLVLSSTATDGWVLLRSGRLVVATAVVPVREVEGMVALAVLVGSGDAGI